MTIRTHTHILKFTNTSNMSTKETLVTGAGPKTGKYTGCDKTREMIEREVSESTKCISVKLSQASKDVRYLVGNVVPFTDWRRSSLMHNIDAKLITAESGIRSSMEETIRSLKQQIDDLNKEVNEMVRYSVDRENYGRAYADLSQARRRKGLSEYRDDSDDSDDSDDDDEDDEGATAAAGVRVHYNENDCSDFSSDDSDDEVEAWTPHVEPIRPVEYPKEDKKDV